MSTTEKILLLLSTRTSRYKGIPINCFGLPIFEEHKKQSLKNSFYRLHSKKFIIYNNSYIKITKEGEKYLKKKGKWLQVFNPQSKEKTEKNLMVIFDIEEGRKIEREWFRRHLKKFGFEMIQKSVWVGPSPLPKEFVSYIKEIKLNNSIKTFKLAKPYKK